MKINYQSLIENVQDLIFTLDINGKFTYINRRLAEFTGKSKGAWLGAEFEALFFDEDAPPANLNLSATLEGKSTTFEARVLNQVNIPVYFSTNLNPIEIDERVEGIVGVSRDVNERVNLQQELTQLKNFNESIIQSMQSGLITLDLEGIITSFNSGAEEALEYKANEVIGKLLWDILGEEATAVLLQKDFRLTPSNREVTVSTRTKKEVHIGFTVTPRLDDESRQVGTIISFKDISQIKRMQAEVLRMDRLASLGVLASGIAHEIKNPLAGIKTMAQTLEEDFSGSDQKKVYMERIVRQVNRLDELLKTFFDYARPRPPQRKYHRVQDIVHEVLTLVDQKLIERNIQWSQEYHEDTPVIFVDFHQIQQVFLNLILNAIDAMQGGGQLKISASPSFNSILDAGIAETMHTQGSRLEKFVRISVADSGVGIEERNLDRIFDPFFTTKSQGTGLGLSIIHRIVTAHHGKINVESTVGKRTVFRVLLPAEEAVS